MSRHYHWADCVVESALALPELPPADPGAQPDIVIRLRNFPTGKQRPEPASFWAEPSHFTLTVPVGRYVVQNGNYINIEAYEPLDEEGLHLFLLGSAFGALAVQRGIFQLHCSAIAGKAGALAFAADSGHGKSTLIAHLTARGFPLVADDTLPLQIRQGEPPLALDTVQRKGRLPNCMQTLGLNPMSFPAIMSGPIHLAPCNLVSPLANIRGTAKDLVAS